MRVYIACSLAYRAVACEVADAVRLLGHRVVSTWHDSPDSTPEAEAELSGHRRRETARRCYEEIDACDMLVLIACPGDRHGAFVEAGYAIGSGRSVVVLENGAPAQLMLSPWGSFLCTSDLAGALGRSGL